MASQNSAIEFRNIVFADDVRREVTGKDIIVGAFGGDIVVGGFPSRMVFCLWISMRARIVGEFRLEIQVLGPSGITISSMSSDIVVEKKDNNAVFVLGGIETELQQEGNIVIRARTNNSEWEEVYSIGVRRAPPQFNQPTASERPS